MRAEDRRRARRRLAAFLAAVAAMALIVAAVHGLTRGREILSLRLAGRELLLLAPRWLVCLAALPPLAVIAGGSLTDLARGQRLLSLAARALLVAALALALARPAVLEPRRRVSLVALLDVSASVNPAQLAEAGRLADELRRAAGETGADLQLVAFGGRPRLLPLPSGPATIGRLDGESEGTDIAAALRLATALHPPGTVRRALLLSDGNQTRGDLLAEARRAGQEGLRLDARAFAAPGDDEILVRRLRLPDAAGLRLGAVFSVEATVFASRATDAEVTLLQDGKPVAADGRRAVHLAAGETRVTFRTQVDQPGVTVFRLTVGGLPSGFRDRFAENNQATDTLSLKGRARVLYVEGEEAAAVHLRRALEREGIDVAARGAGQLPATARELGAFDLVILSDVPATAVGAEAMAALEAYVKDGGGFLMAGGERSLGPGGWAGSRVAKLLPVSLEAERKRDEPSLALVLAIDRSGSMQGEKIELAKEAARSTAELLAGEDLLGVIAFDSQAIPLVRLQRAANRLRIAGDIARLTAGGGTSFLPPLQEAHQQLAPARARVKHVILLSDGQASYDGIAGQVAEMARAGITVSAVGVGGGADKTLLSMIAERGGGRFHFTQDAQSIPRIFARETTEVARSAVSEHLTRARVARRAEVVAGVAFDEAPPLRGHVPTRARPLSETILVTDGGEPLLSRWRVGLGQVAVWTSDVKNRWAADWIAWPGYPKLMAQIVRSTMRQQAQVGGEAGYPVQVALAPPHVRVILDAVGADDRFVGDLEAALRLTPVDPARPPRPDDPPDPSPGLPMQQTAPGRYEGELTMDRYGPYLLRVTTRRGQQPARETTANLSVPFPRELLGLPPDEALLRAAAQATGGRYPATVGEALTPGSDAVSHRRERWPALALLALALLVVDLLLRRVRLLGYRR